MHRLRLFGMPSIEDEDGPLDGPPAQRHRLALLAILACHHPGAVARGRLVDLLWPERAPRKARNLLNQAVHQLRKALGAGTIRSVGAGVLLDRTAIECDLLSFRDALAADDLPGAARLHHAPFLDGFVVPGAPGFERWVCRQRSALDRELAQALETLAAEETTAGAHERAAELWRRRLELDPHAERAVIGLVRSLAASGERSAALGEATVYLRRIRERLGAEPDPRVVAMVVRMKVGDPPGPGGGAIDPRWDTPAPPPAGGLPSGPAHGASGAGEAPTTYEMVGRATELERMEEAWRHAARTGTAFALIAGVAGIGKTRLAEEFLEWAARRGVFVATARSYATEGRVPFGPVADWLRSDALRASLEGVSGPSRSDLALLLPELAIEPRSGTVPPASEYDWNRQRFFRALASAVLGRGEPRLLLIDDLQWCDSDTLQWLHFLLRFDPDAPLLVIGTARLDEVTSRHPLRLLLRDLERDDRLTLTRVWLEPLTADQTAALGEAEAGRPLEDGEARRLFRETEGHPLFVVEGIRAGILAGVDEPDVRTNPLSARVAAIIRARLARLSSDAVRVAGVAAVVGRVFRPELVSDVSELTREKVADALDELIQRRIVRPLGPSFDFTHDKLREVVYADLGIMRRRLLHGRVADALEANAASGIEPIAAELAGHRERAGDPESAIALYRMAAERARGVHGYAEAAEYLRRALALVEEGVPAGAEERSRLQLDLEAELGDSLLRTRGWASPEAAAAHERELELAESLADQNAICRALWGLQSVLMVRSQARGARTLGRRLHRLARDHEHALFTAAGHFTIGFASYVLGEFAPARRDLRQGISRFRGAGGEGLSGPISEQVGILLHCTASHAAWQLAAESEAAALERRARDLAERLDSPFARTAALVYSAILSEHRGDRAGAFELASGAIAVGEEFGFVHYLHTARVIRAWAIADESLLRESLTEIRSAVRDYRSIGSSIRLPYFLGIEARVSSRGGQYDRALSLVDEGLSHCNETGERWPEATLLDLRGDLLQRIGGDVEAVRECRKRATAVARELGARSQLRRIERSR